MFKTKFTAVGGLGALILTLAACGGGSSGLKKADLAARANAICGAQQAKISAVPTPSNIQDPAQAAAFFDATVPLVDREVSDVAALKPAADAKTQFDDLVAKAQSYRQLADTIKQKADAKDASGLQDLQRLQPVQDQANQAAVAFGATACSNASSASDERTFKAAYQPIRVEFNAITKRLQILIQGASKSTDAQLAARLRILSTRAGAATAKLGALTAPATIAGEFAALKAAVQKIPADLGTVADEVAAHSQTARQGTQTLVSDVNAASIPGKAITTKLGLPAAQ